MRVRITAKAGYSNPRRDIQLASGELADVPDGVAVKLLNMGLAVAAPDPEVETATVAPAEHTAKRVSKPKPKARKSSRPAKEEAE